MIGDSKKNVQLTLTILFQKNVNKNCQTLKIQEAPELIPTGEISRSFIVSTKRSLVDKVTPGMRVIIVGVFSIQ